ncbi:beta-lactamase domain protein [Desulforamulus reducens MI-1]|uniref:Beta-lactamase domain protein n=1 Tax=Desulforamulus reducens (strain ATCC BAA-1160 / DSM 100696 / MI-1) TaxID=349161 RepID=A4J731_DESRM|nr:MBL fold metallo-hydrolase [Desulforamulus reducens]ABO50884.1 beta-lactamase domain protein [Desulforamulus reducens MI-1]
MQLTVLVDNNTIIDRYLIGEPGLSFFLETGGKRILFDTGYSDAFIQNAGKIGINLRVLDYVVLSHGHMDHTWGLDPLIRLYTEAIIENQAGMLKPVVVGHSDVFYSKRLKGMGEIGSTVAKSKLSQHFELKLLKNPLWLTEKLVFLGEIPRTYEFEAKTPLGTVLKKSHEEEDFLLDDTALAYKAKDGLVIIVGCSHSGICNIVEYAKKVCQDERVLDIIGGFHLLSPPRSQMDGVKDYLRTLQPKEVHACHCTDLQAKIELSEVVNLKEVGVGLKLQYD